MGVGLDGKAGASTRMGSQNGYCIMSPYLQRLLTHEMERQQSHGIAVVAWFCEISPSSVCFQEHTPEDLSNVRLAIEHYPRVTPTFVREERGVACHEILPRKTAVLIFGPCPQVRNLI